MTEGFLEHQPFTDQSYCGRASVSKDFVELLSVPANDLNRDRKRWLGCQKRDRNMWTIQCCTPCLSAVNFAVSGRQRVSSLEGSCRLCPTLRDFLWKPVSLTSDNKPALQLGARAAAGQSSGTLRTCRHCKQSFDPETNHPRACLFHTAHFGGETKRKFESVYTGGTMDTLGGGEIVEYWHCCGSKDRFDPGCEAAAHASYDD